MRKWNLYWVALAMLMVGCQRNYDVVSLRVAHEVYGSGGKVYVDDEKYACWVGGDSVNINNVGYVVEVNNGTRINQVRWRAEGYTAVYPHECVVEVSDSRVDMNLPREDKYSVVTIEGVDRQELLNPMVARTDASEGSLFFKNVGALVGIKLTNVGVDALTVDKIQLEATEASLYGKAQISNIGEENLTTTMTEGGNNRVLWGIDKVLGACGTANCSETFYICIPPVSVVGNQFRVKVIFHVGEQYYEFCRTTSTEVGRINRNETGVIPVDISTTTGSYIELGNGLMGDGSDGDAFIVANKADLDALKGYCETRDRGMVYVRQVADLVCSETWNGIGKKEVGGTEYYFKGHYDGGGYSVRMNNSVSGLFNYVGDGAVIKNVVVKGTIDLTESGNRFVGGVVNNIENVQNLVRIDNCVNEAIIKGNNSSLNEARWIGGLCGRVVVGGNIELINCVNRGMLEGGVRNSQGYQIRIGGLCGRYSGGGIMKLSNCRNEANIEFKNGNVYKIGGLVGECGSGLELWRCVNSGNLVNAYEGNISSEKFIGGLVGKHAGGELLSIKECANHGEIVNGYSVGGLVAFVYACKNLTIQDSYSDNLFKNCNRVGGLVDSCYSVSEKIKMDDCYVRGIFEGTSVARSWICRKTIAIAASSYSNMYVPDTVTCGIMGTKKNMDIDMDNDTDIFLIGETLMSDLNRGRDIWKMVGADVRLKFE